VTQLQNINAQSGVTRGGLFYLKNMDYIKNLTDGIERGREMETEPIKWLILHPTKKQIIEDYFKPLAAKVTNVHPTGEYLNGLRVEYNDICPMDIYLLQSESAHRQFKELEKELRQPMHNPYM
jgi:hypothetical protein